MTAVSSVYAQRFITTLFLVSFGIYLFLATVTYTPFDPGWMHISSDTQQVSNASGVAGAWVADLLFGFLGWASLLIPLFFFIEAIQLWWPHSFLSKSFRYAAQFFILLATATLLYLFWHIPNDALDNASGGIIGYEIGKNLVQLLTIYGASLFLMVLWFMLFTLAFGIQWHKTWAMLKATPNYLQDLFYRNVPEHEADHDLTLKNKPVMPQKVEEPTTHSSLPEHVEKNLPKTVSTVQINDPAAEKLFAHLVKQEQTSPPLVSEAVSEPIVEKTPQPEKVLETGEVWRALDSKHSEQHQQDIDALLKLAEDQQNLTPSETANDVKTPSLDWNDEKIFNELLDAVPQHQQEIKQTYAQTQSPEHIRSHDDATLKLKISTEDQHLHDIEKLLAVDTTVVSEPEPITPKPIELEPKIEKNSHPYAQSSSFVQTQMTTDLHQNLSKQEFVEAWQETAGTPETEADDFDQPLTDAHGRPISRAMQVVKKRSGLSLIPEKLLLDKVDPNKKINFTQEQLARLSELLEIKLQEFNVKAKVVEAQPGPVVTRFELDLAPGVKASKVTNISRDLARSMSMASVRVVEVIPGKPYIGIEVPNSSREMVRLTELLDTEEYLNPNNLISVAMGKDISGRPVLADLAKAPHMLVAGTTGSGKSVAVNAMILSMLLKYTPNDLRLILIDPKQLELANYSDIPHLLTPVVTDMKDAVSALNWCVNEMERRYKLMSFLKVRKIVDYNRKVKEAIMSGEDLIDPTWKPSDSATQERAPRLQTLPMIVIVADEFADMIMQVGKKAEEMITRLAQKSRAAGIHLLLATQRPSVDVITGLIKANIPTRVALRVNSKIDSRTILDAGGAEDLLGHGDMLFLGPGKIEPERVHGAFISDDEVNRICDAWRERGDPDYVDEILTPYDEEQVSRSGSDDGESSPDTDVLYDQAVAFVLETRKATASSIQRKFSLGYNRAARLIDTMEENGIVSSMGANGKRDILV
ncbi:DNA translocase FtsK 4TM domain-containing protein [Acinetobacter sp. B10A]|uniref:DNA translocase FtsK n=1 Tax=Acinetobacter baretiae TaxID=2605383 RepID=UPI001B3C995D|nr:DNA translocase FtsK [Acinetobacter baretiae]MBF7684775.1 DNA translocase FtsK 4TM domain-containing protein [Acinetobacter baretiae]